AHSLGAIVTRQALLYALEEKTSWCKVPRLLLFAPAHKGSDIVAMVSSILAMIRPLSEKGVAALMELAYPVLKDLNRKSRTWKRLEKQCLRAIPSTLKPGDDHPLIALRVILGDTDRIVEPDSFGKDPIPDVLTGGHTTICKPTPTFGGPLQLLIRVL